MKNYRIVKRIEDVSRKLEVPAEGFPLIDFNLSESEKKLFQRVDEISEEYNRTGNDELLKQNDDLIRKNIEIMQERITELFCYAYPTAICGYTALDREIVNYFFQLHFINFEIDLLECVKSLCRWNESDKEEFLADLKKNGPSYFRIPRGFNDYNQPSTKCVSSSDSDKTEEEKKEQK